MAKIPEAMTRLYKNVFICKNCKTKVRSEARRIISGKVRCRKCNGKDFRAVKKK
jgi:hypothetical protein